MKRLILTLSTLLSISVFACGESNICEGDRVQFIDAAGFSAVGIAQEVFNNGMVKINSPYYPSYIFRDTSEVAKALECFNNICEGDKVQFTDDAGFSAVGIVKEVFNNGLVKINSTYYPSYIFRDTSDIDKSGILD